MAAKKTIVPIDEKRAELALEWARIQERIQPDQERIAAIKVELEELPPSKYAIPGVELKVDVTQGSSFRADLFMAAHPISTAPQYYKAVPDLDRIKAAMSPDQLAAFAKPNKPSVKLV